MLTDTKPPRNLQDFSGDIAADDTAAAPFQVAQVGQGQWQITIGSKAITVVVREGKMRVTNQPWSLLVQLAGQAEGTYREKLETIFDELNDSPSPFSRGALGSGRDIVTIARGLAQIRAATLAEGPKK
jgi:hypothetical protein